MNLSIVFGFLLISALIFLWLHKKQYKKDLIAKDLAISSAREVAKNRLIALKILEEATKFVDAAGRPREATAIEWQTQGKAALAGWVV